MTMNRPKPDALLQRIQEEENKEKRGKLKIYLGAAPGVGKTFSMLNDALTKRAQGLDVVVGIVETHNRKEIETLLKDLEILPRLKVNYHGNELTEFDLDAALKRNPGLILIDEMAHTNIPDLRHAKRWQDIKELLDRQIDVYTTLNVQHVESLNDVVSQIIHTRVKETVPDFMLELADTIELVDLPTEDLLKRLQEGKVYFPKQAELAAEHFFRKGNLTALRELALRVTAERVGEQVLLYRQGQGIKHIWPTRQKILVCVGSRSESSKLIRAASRMATKLQADWVAIHVDTPKIILTEAETQIVIQNLRLAEKLGAETRIVMGFDVVKEILSFAREQNINLIMLWKHIRSRWRDFIFRSLADELTRQSGEIDIYIVTSEADDQEFTPDNLEPVRNKHSLRIYGIAIITVLIATWINLFLMTDLGGGNLILVYLLGVALVSLFGEMGPSILTSVLSVIGYNFFMTYPDMMFYPDNLKNTFTLLMMFLTTQVIGYVTVSARQQVKSARLIQEDTAILHTLSRQLAGTRGVDKLLGIAVRFIGEAFNCAVLVLMPENERMIVRAGFGMEPVLDEKEKGVAQWAYSLGQNAGMGTDTLPFSNALYVPLIASQGPIGVLRIKPAHQEKSLSQEKMHVLESCASQIALALEVDRMHEHNKKVELQTTADEARLALLKSVSNDLNTPLVAVIGAASTLMEMGKTLDRNQIHKLSTEILFEVDQLSRLINNLLQMTYLEADAVILQLNPNSLKETIHQVLDQMKSKIGKRKVNIRLPDSLPLVVYDNELIQNVLGNLLDNALKFTPAKSPIDVSAVLDENKVMVSVEDRGPGIVFDEVNKLFEKYYRGRLLTTERGLGLGLAICYSIITAHGGEIWAENRPGGGAIFRFTLLL